MEKWAAIAVLLSVFLVSSVLTLLWKANNYIEEINNVHITLLENNSICLRLSESVSHELKSPITSIRLLSGLMESGKSTSKEKIKKGEKEKVTLELYPTRDILQWIAKNKTTQVVVGFAAETQNIIQNALEKLQRKKLDLIVANDISSPGLGFQSDSNQVTLISGEKEIEALPVLSKMLC